MGKLANKKTEMQSPEWAAAFPVLVCFGFETVSLAFSCYDKTWTRPAQEAMFGLQFLITVHH